jgi:hypothetical protein
LNKKGFMEFLEKKNKSERTINRYADFAQQYEAYLLEHKKGKKIEIAGKKDLHDFEKWAENNNIKVNQYLWGIKMRPLRKTNLPALLLAILYSTNVLEK